MSTITKQWLQQTIADMEEHRDLFPVDLDDNHENVLAALRIALASLEAEAVAYIGERMLDSLTDGARSCGRVWPVVTDEISGERRIPLYTAPPAPVSVPDVPFDENSPYDVSCSMPSNLRELIAEEIGILFSDDDAQSVWDVCRRAAMLQGADGNSPAQSDCCPEQNCISPAQDGNSPVIPDGYALVPLKLTADNGAKGALCGEFHVQYRIVCQSCVGEGCEDCNHTGGWDAEIPVSWDTIKRIHESAVEACALPAAPQQEDK